jgi:hypothetical protein
MKFTVWTSPKPYFFADPKQTAFKGIDGGEK